jgi:hypothetical protein
MVNAFPCYTFKVMAITDLTLDGRGRIGYVRGALIVYGRDDKLTI